MDLITFGLYGIEMILLRKFLRFPILFMVNFLVDKIHLNPLLSVINGLNKYF